MKIKKHVSYLVSILALTFIAIFALRSAIFTPGIIGHTWDWGIPNFAEQFRAQTKASFFMWDDRLYGGFFFPFKIELPYWLLIFPFSFLGGAVLSKLIPLFIFILAALSMFTALKKTFSLSYFWSFLGAVLYMLSPFSYSRLIGGHLPVLLGYALLPLIFSFAVSLFGVPVSKEGIRSWWPKSLFIALTLALGIIHPIAIFASWLLVFSIAAIYFIFRKGGRVAIVKKLFLIFTFWFLLNLYWLWPILFQLISGKELSARPWQPITEELSFRLPYFDFVSRPLIELFTFSFPPGLHTEFAYPLSDFIKPFFVFSSVILFAASLIAFYLVYKSNKKYAPVVFVLTLIEFLGIALATGNKTIIGRALFFVIIQFIPILFSGFSNPLRFLPLVMLPLFTLAVITFVVIEEKLKQFGQAKFFLRIIIGLVVFIFLYPWFLRSLKTPIFEGQSQPMSLKVTEINSEDRQVFSYLGQSGEDFRLVHLPPAYVSWPGETDLSYVWNTSLFPKPLFLEYKEPPLSGETIESLYSQKTSRDLSKLLGLGAVRTIVYPHYQSFPETYQVFIKNTLNYKPVLDRNWNKQKGIKEKVTDFSTVDIYENENFVPHIFIPEKVTFVDGDKSLLVDIVSFPDYQLRNAIFSPLKEGAKTEFALSQTEDIYIKPNYIGEFFLSQQLQEELRPGVRLLPSSPLYGLIKLKEERMKRAIGSDTGALANLDLILMSKRVAEIKEMTRIGIDKEEWPKTARRYHELLDDFSTKLDGLLGERGLENDLLIKALVFLSDHQEALDRTSQEVAHSELSKEIRDVIVKTNQILARIKEDVWLTEEEEERKYLFTVPETGDYSFFTSSEAGEEINFEIDGQTFLSNGESVNNWLFLGKINLEGGSHRLKLILPEQPNLFPGLTTSLIVEEISSSNETDISYRLLGQKEAVAISAKLLGLDDQAEYEVSFRYKNEGSRARFAVEQTNDEMVGGFFIHKIDEFLPADNRWKRFKISFSPNPGSQEAALRFYLPANKTGGETYYVEAIEVRKILKPTLIFKKEVKKNGEQLPKIKFTKINPTKYRIKIEDARAPYFLVFSETFNSDWKAYVNTKEDTEQEPVSIASYFDGQISEGKHENTFLDKGIFSNLFKKPIAEERHLLVNAFANAWYVDQLGNYEIILEFVPQRVYFLGIWFSFIVLLFVLLNLLALFIKRRKDHVAKFK